MISPSCLSSITRLTPEHRHCKDNVVTHIHKEASCSTQPSQLDMDSEVGNPRDLCKRLVNLGQL